MTPKTYGVFTSVPCTVFTLQHFRASEVEHHKSSVCRKLLKSHHARADKTDRDRSQNQMPRALSCGPLPLPCSVIPPLRVRSEVLCSAIVPCSTATGAATLRLLPVKVRRPVLVVGNLELLMASPPPRCHPQATPRGKGVSAPCRPQWPGCHCRAWLAPPLPLPQACWPGTLGACAAAAAAGWGS